MSEGGGELRSPVGDDFVKKSKAEENLVEEKGGDSFSGNRFLGRAQNHPLSKPMVYHDQERIKAQGNGKVRDKITGNLLEGAEGKRFDRRKGGYGGMRVNFILLAGGTALNISANEGSESRPPELSGDQLMGFKETGMAGGLMVVASFEDGAAEGIVSGDVDTALIGEDTSLGLPVSEVGAKGERDVRVHRLKCL